MKWYHKLLLGLNIGAGLTLVQIPVSYHVMQQQNKSIEPYVKKNLAKIMKAQEKKLGIKHIDKPNLKFGIPDKENNIPGRIMTGQYKPWEDSISLRIRSTITPETNLSNILKEIVTFGEISDIKATLDHELGHFYADKVNESMGMGDWPGFTYRTYYDILCTKLIAEGIATYFEKSMNDGKDEFKDSDWTGTLLDLIDPEYVYNGGYHLVKPIIDKYGRKGIEHLILTPPRISEISDLPKYQKRILDGLKFEKYIIEALKGINKK
jgi:hypothetical protein